MISRLKEDHVTSVLECSGKLCGVQSELQLSFAVNGFCFWVIFKPAEARKTSLKEDHKRKYKQVSIFINKKHKQVGGGCYILVGDFKLLADQGGI